MKLRGDDYGVRARRMVVFYLSVFFLIVIAVLYASRFVLFQPWTAREWVGGAAVGDDLYIFGGKDAEGAYDSIYRIDLDRASVRRAGHLDEPRLGLTGVSLGDRIYLAGGLKGSEYTADVLVYDPRTRGVRILARFPTPRGFGAFVAHQGRLYYLGGL